jgi:hypothetical protein
MDERESRVRRWVDELRRAGVVIVPTMEAGMAAGEWEEAICAAARAVGLQAGAGAADRGRMLIAFVLDPPDGGTGSGGQAVRDEAPGWGDQWSADGSLGGPR